MSANYEGKSRSQVNISLQINNNKRCLEVHIFQGNQ